MPAEALAMSSVVNCPNPVQIRLAKAGYSAEPQQIRGSNIPMLYQEQFDLRGSTPSLPYPTCSYPEQWGDHFGVACTNLRSPERLLHENRCQASGSVIQFEFDGSFIDLFLRNLFVLRFENYKSGFIAFNGMNS